MEGRLEVEGRVGVVFQDPESQLVMDTIEDDVAFGLENVGWPADRMRVAVAEALADVGLAGSERRRPNTLSGGEQQRLALAGALAAGPDVLVLDEPTANLDPPSAAAFLDRLAARRSERGTTIVLVEHRVELAWASASCVLALGRDGRPIDVGPPDEVLARSGDRMAAAGIWLPTDAPPVTASPARDRGPVLAVAEAVSYAYGRGVTPAVDGVSLEIGRGERVAFLGPNGSGKSTLGRLLVGLLRPSSGHVSLAGVDPARLPAPDLARSAGFVFQDPEHQFLAPTVRADAELRLGPAELARLPGLMSTLGLPLDEFGDRSPYTLSGGEKRRLSLVGALVRQPRLLVLDEPTFGLDRLNHEALVGLLRDRVASGTSLLAATHDLRLAAALFERAVVLREGRIAMDGPTASAIAEAA